LINAIAFHQMLWLEGLQQVLNPGDSADSFRRNIDMRGLSFEAALGKPTSHGCVHRPAADLISLYDSLTVGTLVWIRRRVTLGGVNVWGGAKIGLAE